MLRLALACWVMGVGMGFIASPALIAAQSSADWATRGVVTGTNLFARSVGSAVGVAVFGAIANAAVAARGWRAANRTSSTCRRACSIPPSTTCTSPRRWPPSSSWSACW